MATGIEVKNEWRCFGGRLVQFSHSSAATGTPMRCSVFLPPPESVQRRWGGDRSPAVYYLSGLTCTDENFTQKAGAQRVAAELGLALVAPDTSPRGAGVEGEDDSWDFGTGAGFYLNATQEPWSTNYRMYEYIVNELPEVIKANFPVINTDKASIMGHSMGGHGALTIAFKNPDKYASVSAFSPICNPCECPWGIKAFTNYLGEDKEQWKQYDATELVRSAGPFPKFDILIDQGAADGFLEKGQLRPEAFAAACEEKGQRVNLRFQEGYDHSYFFIATFIEDHLRHHAERLAA